jgi:hypothetical protein
MSRKVYFLPGVIYCTKVALIFRNKYILPITTIRCKVLFHTLANFLRLPGHRLILVHMTFTALYADSTHLAIQVEARVRAMAHKVAVKIVVHAP